jgi:hypothetical protein
MLDCLAVDVLCDVSASVQGIKTLRTLPKLQITQKKSRLAPLARCSQRGDFGGQRENVHLLLAQRNSPRCDQNSARNLPKLSIFHPKFGPSVQHCQALLHSISTRPGSMWLDAVPYAPSLRLSDQAFQDTARVLMGVRTFSSFGNAWTCACGHTVEGDDVAHALGCNRLSWPRAKPPRRHR